MNEPCTISVGIPTMNRPDDIKLLFDCIAKNETRPDYIICCDQSDDNETKQAFENFKIKFPEINIIYSKSKIKSATYARNEILKRTTTDFIILIDDDILFTRTFFSTLLSKLNNDIKCININVIESKYYKKIYKTYDDFNIDLNKLSSFLPRFGFNFRILNFYYKLTLNSYYKKNTMEISRLGRVIGDYCTNNDIIGKVMSGIMVLHKDIYSKYFFEEHFSGYTLLEDLEYSIRISKENNVYIYRDLWVYHNKKLYDSARLSNSNLIKTHYKNVLFIFQKHIKQTIINKILMAYSRIMFCIIQSLKFMVKTDWKSVKAHYGGLFFTMKQLFCLRESND